MRKKIFSLVADSLTYHAETSSIDFELVQRGVGEFCDISISRDLAMLIACASADELESLRDCIKQAFETAELIRRI